ncbi:MAG: hypothetical protein RQ826_02725 [Xanthomonadales bacterium]|nr:hypothetical protein [Xanthomonadales bacterium]
MSPRIALLIIFGIFVLPLLLAWLMYSGVINFEPVSTRNLGQLVRPPVPTTWESMEFAGVETTGSTPATELAEHWVVLYALPESCAEQCLQTVVDLRQVHRALGRHQTRIRLALLLPAALSGTSSQSLMKIYEQLHLLRNPSGDFRVALSKATEATGTPNGSPATVYLVDPQGNVMMRYPKNSDPNDLKIDLQRLMTWSKQDEQR